MKQFSLKQIIQVHMFKIRVRGAVIDPDTTRTQIWTFIWHIPPQLCLKQAKFGDERAHLSATMTCVVCDRCSLRLYCAINRLEPDMAASHRLHPPITCMHKGEVMCSVIWHHFIHTLPDKYVMGWRDRFTLVQNGFSYGSLFLANCARVGLTSAPPGQHPMHTCIV
jgi:hypothetical protein